LPEFVKGNRADFIPKFIPSAIWDKNHKTTKDTKDTKVTVVKESFVSLRVPRGFYPKW
jgi:hypothetical protein